MNTTPNAGSVDVIEATIADLHEAMKAGELTAATIVDRYLARIDAYDEELNSILTVNPNAGERAAELDEAFRSDGFIGPLHGIPIILKDNQDTYDMVTTAGSAALAESIPPTDAFIVKQLRDAGGIVLAKANLQELSFGVDTISSLGGETRNAYALNHRPSGSSGGTAAAIAANLGTIGTGTDTCSSVRSPPAFNNLVGVRPTRGLVSRSGIIPLSETQDTAGPITRTVTDAAKMLDVMVGYDPEDPVTAKGVGNVPEEGYAASLDPDGLSGARIGVVRELFGRKNPENASKEAAEAVTAAVEGAIEEMDAAGATIVDSVGMIDDDYLQAARVLRYEFKRDLNNYLATLEGSAPGSMAEMVATGKITPTVEERIEEGPIIEMDVEGLDANPDYLKALDRRRHIEVDILRRMAEHDLDALLYPPSRIPPVERPANQPFEEMPCELSAHTGLPSIVLPAGFTDEGLPVGVELLGRRFDEPTLFELAYGYEQSSSHRQPPERFGSLE